MNKREHNRFVSRKRIPKLFRDLLLTLLYAAVLVGIGYGLRTIW